MITYIRNTYRGSYVEFPEEIDASYWEGKIGNTYSDYLQGKWVKLSNEQVQFHKDYPKASISEVLNMELNSTPERTLQDAKNEVIQRIRDYDNSLNSFTVNGINSWLTPEERSNYRSSIEASETVGRTDITFCVGDTEFTISIEQAKLLLAQIQLYADRCFIITKRHIASVNELETVQEIDEYVYTQDYPNKLEFDL